MRPGKEIGMDDLVGVAAQDEVGRMAEGAQGEVELDCTSSKNSIRSRKWKWRALGLT